MEVKKKDMKKTGWKRAIDKEYTSKQIELNGIKGVVSLNVWRKISEPLVIHYTFKDTLIADDNYKWVQIALQDQNFWITAMYDNNDDLIEIYFDITNGNYFEDLDNPYFYDLFTDIVITNNGDIHIVDEDELEEALKENTISIDEYNKANKTTKRLYEYLTNNKEYVINTCEKYLKELKQNV